MKYQWSEESKSLTITAENIEEAFEVGAIYGRISDTRAAAHENRASVNVSAKVIVKELSHPKGR